MIRLTGTLVLFLFISVFCQEEIIPISTDSTKLFEKNNYITFPNDSTKNWENIMSIWKEPDAVLIIKGITNNFSFPPMIPDKKRKNISYFAKGVLNIRLSEGIYCASIIISHQSSYIFFATGDSIKVLTNYDCNYLINEYLIFCKHMNYNNKTKLEFLDSLIKWVLKRY